MAAKRAEADLLFRRVGITFAVYGESDDGRPRDGQLGTERLIPFDIIPRVITSDGVAAAGPGPHAAGPRAECLPGRCLPRPGNPARRPHPAGTGPLESPVPAGDARGERARRHLRPHRRHRRGPGRRGRVLRPRGQSPRAVRRFLHARGPQDDDAALSRSSSPGMRWRRSSTTRTCCSTSCAAWRPPA